jgi:hypothetical protein
LTIAPWDERGECVETAWRGGAVREGRGSPG